MESQYRSQCFFTIVKWQALMNSRNLHTISNILQVCQEVEPSCVCAKRFTSKGQSLDANKQKMTKFPIGLNRNSTSSHYGQIMNLLFTGPAKVQSTKYKLTQTNKQYPIVISFDFFGLFGGWRSKQSRCCGLHQGRSWVMISAGSQMWLIWRSQFWGYSSSLASSLHQDKHVYKHFHKHFCKVKEESNMWLKMSQSNVKMKGEMQQCVIMLMQAVFMVPFNYNLEKNVEALKRQCDKAEKAFNTVIYHCHNNSKYDNVTTNECEWNRKLLEGETYQYVTRPDSQITSRLHWKICT